MTALPLDKIKNMLGAHNDGVYRLQARDNLSEIVGMFPSTGQLSWLRNMERQLYCNDETCF